MKLTTELGQKIINETKKLINENIIIVNEKAIIIASTDSTRVGDFHEGALQTIKTNKTTILTDEHVDRMIGIRPGVNLPITLDNKVIGVIGITGDPEEIVPFASLMKKMTELLIQENIYIQKSEWHKRATEAYFFDWVQMDHIPEEFLERGKILGIHLTPPLRITLIEGNMESEKLLSEMIQLLPLNIDCLATRLGHNRILLITDDKGNNISQLKNTLHSFFQHYSTSKTENIFSIGIGPITNSFRIKDSYQKAQKALSIGKKGSITAYEDLLLEICLEEVSKPTRKELIAKIFTPILADETLYNTLKVFIKNNLNLKISAKELHIHINTLHYRLNRIEELTGYNPKTSYSIALFYTLFYFLDENINY